MDNKFIGSRIAELRKKSNCTQEELANSLGVDRQTVRRWENGETTLKADNINRLCAIFAVSPEYLIGGDTKAYNDEKNGASEEEIAATFNGAIASGLSTDKISSAVEGAVNAIAERRNRVILFVLTVIIGIATFICAFATVCAGIIVFQTPLGYDGVSTGSLSKVHFVFLLLASVLFAAACTFLIVWLIRQKSKTKKER